MADAVHTAERLKELQALPLDRKIQISQTRIIEWYQRNHGNVVVSFSGGKDSTVLLHMVRSLYPDVPAVFSNTGLEYPEIQRFVRTFPNVEIVSPKMNFMEVVSTYGYPLIGKEVAEAIYYARRIRSQTVHVEREQDATVWRKQRELLGIREIHGGGVLEISSRRADQPTDGRSCKGDGEIHRKRTEATEAPDGLRSRNAPQTERPHGSMADSGTSNGRSSGGGRIGNSTRNGGGTTKPGRDGDTNSRGSGGIKPG